MPADTPIKPLRLEVNNSGAWKLIATVDLADTARLGLLMTQVHDLATTLNDDDSRAWITFRLSTGDTPVPLSLYHWDRNGRTWMANAQLARQLGMAR